MRRLTNDSARLTEELGILTGRWARYPGLDDLPFGAIVSSLMLSRSRSVTAAVHLVDQRQGEEDTPASRRRWKRHPA